MGDSRYIGFLAGILFLVFGITVIGLTQENTRNDDQLDISDGDGVAWIAQKLDNNTVLVFDEQRHTLEVGLHPDTYNRVDIGWKSKLETMNSTEWLRDI